MTKIGVSELHESLGWRDYGTSGRRTRAVFHHEPLLRLYKLEIPSLFGLLLKHEGTTLDRADPNLFDKELDRLLAEFGPLIWPVPGQGHRDHLLEPFENSRYTTDLVYPRDSSVSVYPTAHYETFSTIDTVLTSTSLKSHLRNLILNKHARPSIDIDALIEKRHKDANLRIFGDSHSGDSGMRKTKLKAKSSTTANGGRQAGKKRLVSLTDDSSDGSEAPGGWGSDSQDSFADRPVRKRSRVKDASQSFRVALRLYRKTSPQEFESSGPGHTCGTTFFTADMKTAEDGFTHVSRNIGQDCTYMEFHPPEDMSCHAKIRVERGSQEAEATFRRVMKILQGARLFSSECSYRTVGVEIGIS